HEVSYEPIQTVFRWTRGESDGTRRGVRRRPGAGRVDHDGSDVRPAAVQPTRFDQPGEREEPRGQMDVLDRRPERPRRESAGDRQRDVRAQRLPEHRVRARSDEAGRADDLEVPAEAARRSEADRVLRPGEPWSRLPPERQAVYRAA